MKSRPIVPTPWRHVGLTLLPALVFLLTYILPGQLIPEMLLRLLAPACLVFLIVSTLWLLVRNRRPIPAPVWALIPLGFFGALGAMMAVSPFDFYLACLVLAVASLGCARVNGPSAGLVLLSGGTLLASAAIEPGMYLAPGPYSRVLLADGIIVLFMILTPILVLRARSIPGQAAGLVVPLAAYSAVFVFALTRDSGMTLPMFQFSIDQALSVAAPYIVLIGIMALAVPVYTWVWSPPKMA